MMLTAMSALSAVSPQAAKPPTISAAPYTLKVSVDEVSLTFHAADFHGIPMDDLKLDDLRIVDNGKRPRQIVSFEAHQNLPVRFGILVDTSRSMLEYLRRNQAIANEYLAQLLRKQTDHAFLMRFDSDSKVLQDWTGDSNLLTATLRNVAAAMQVDQAAQLSSTPSTRPAAINSEPTTRSPATSSCSSPTASITPATPVSKTTSTSARKRT